MLLLLGRLIEHDNSSEDLEWQVSKDNDTTTASSAFTFTAAVRWPLIQFAKPILRNLVGK